MQRRDLFRWAAMSVAAGMVGRAAGGCTNRDAGRRAAGGELERELRIAARPGVFERGLLDGFQRETGAAVSLDGFDAAPGAAPPPDVDLLALPAVEVGAMVRAEHVAALDRTRVPGVARLLPWLRPDEAAEVYGVPFAWEATGIAWRTGRLPDTPGAAPTSWCVFFEPSLAGRMTMLDDPREVFGAMLRLRNRSLNAVNGEVLAQARDDALACRSLLQGYRAAGAPLLDGEVVVAQARSSTAARAMRSDPGIDFGIPEEGGPLHIEQLALAAGAPHPRAAHAFIDYILRPGTSERIAAASGRHSPLDGTAPALPLDRLEPLQGLGEAASLYDRHWTEVRPA